MVIKMGWFGIYGKFASVTDYAVQELAITNPDHTLLDRAIVNNYVYSLVQRGNGSTFILIDHVKRDGNQWSHRPMDETFGPDNYDCPERILKQSTSNNSVAVKWRENCRQHRRDKALRLRLTNELKHGMIIKSKYFGSLAFISLHGKTKLVCTDNLGGRYAYPLRDFSVEELQNAINEG